ncbi:inorganic phosphate transporter [Pseudonocardia broussonetiae]|uniref:Phosphate transporter n=1 Tax=Pseudonocardia broussonetiae TaxID=2736640 RepID=A0A6M6JMI3_9PSEU|nr:inorganic phosphate transporter [Pseudonocardia broussonetiae]QJY49178.1 inorganic phosphate transporter [Pseudonocardia broussonetiae]
MDVALVVGLVVVTALIFDFTNGFHDTANAMATSIATGALRPKVAVTIAGLLNLAGAFLSVQVAMTIAGGLVDEARITPAVVFAALVGAILWNMLTWLLGLPSSSSHALFGGLIGATLVVGGAGAVNVGGLLGKVVVPAIVSPLLAGLIALVATGIVYLLTARADPGTADRGFRAGQVLSASMVALAHGANDAQKTMGVITLTLVTAGLLRPGSTPPLWVVLSAALAIALGTYMGGWRIIRTLGKRVGDIRSAQGFTAETTSAAIILTSTHLGIPLSTTQVCTGSIFGAAAGRRLASVHWSLARRLVLAWVVTLPAAAAVGATASWVAAHGPGGVAVVAATGLALGGGIYAASRRSPVTADNVTDMPASPPASLAA